MSKVTDEMGKVIVIWISEPQTIEDGMVHVISDKYTGEPRVYDRDAVDPRCGDVRFVPELGLALAEMSESPGPQSAVQLPLTEARFWGIV